MRKLIILLFLSIFAFSFAACALESVEQQSQNENTDISVEAETNCEENQSYNLDLQYEKDIANCKSNSDITSTNSEYAEEWYDLGTSYYSLIMSENFEQNCSEKQEIVTNIHNNWAAYATQRIADEKVRLEAIYNGGTIVPVKLSYFKYSLYRAHTLELYNMCLEFYIDCEMP